jgi:acetyl-CoA C-acetyltransferase
MTIGSVAIAAVGIHPFGRSESSGIDQGAFAVRNALNEAGITWREVQFAYGGSHAAGNPDTMVSQLGLSGLPFINVSNGCATGTSSLIAAYNEIQSGASELGVVVGFDKHPRGAFDPKPEDWGLEQWYGESGLMLTTQFFALKIQRYMSEFGITAATLAKVAAKAYFNGSLNPNAWRRKPLTEEEILESPMISHPLTQYMFCSPGEGAVALVLCRADKARYYTDRPVYLRASVLRTRRYGTFEVFSPWLSVERTPSPTVDAARAAFEMASIGPDDIEVIQIQDTESGAEVIHLAECGFCAHGEQEELVQSGATELTGKLPVNTDGGCLANGEPIGASGLRQIHELVLQLRGVADDRQIPGTPRTGFAHVYGAPGLSACTVLST